MATLSGCDARTALTADSPARIPMAHRRAGPARVRGRSPSRRTRRASASMSARPASTSGQRRVECLAGFRRSAGIARCGAAIPRPGVDRSCAASGPPRRAPRSGSSSACVREPGRYALPSRPGSACARCPAPRTSTTQNCGYRDSPFGCSSRTVTALAARAHDPPARRGSCVAGTRRPSPMGWSR